MTAAEVLTRAFASTERIREELISDSKIETAQFQYLKPVLGRLFGKLTEKEYTEFVEGFLKAPLAYYVRSLVVDELAACAGASGVLQHCTDYAAAVSLERQERLKKQARHDADILMDRAVEYIEKNPERFPDYDPRENIRKKVSFRGGIIV